MNATRAHATPRRRRWRGAVRLRAVLLSLFALAVLGVVTFVLAYTATSVPSPNDLATAQTSIVYYSDGRTEMDRISEVNRESVPLSKVPLHVQQALLAAEDRDFYANNGVSVRGTFRALVNDLRGGVTQGGSTITQQYVKNYFLDADQTLTRKAKELMIALKIDRSQSKASILENYLNTIYFGRGAYGIQTAARAYFGTDVSHLSVAQGALLASVIRGPSLYDPRGGAAPKALAEGRFAYVLDGMAGQGWITPAQRAAASFPSTVPVKTNRGKGGTTGYLTAMVREELKRTLKLTDDDIDRRGLRIVTTIDKSMQAAAVSAVHDNLPTGGKDVAALHAGLTAIKPGDGAILALYGGKDYAKSQLNTSTQAHMQAGSTFKVFGVAAALQQGVSTKTRFDGSSPQYIPEFAGAGNPRGKVRNFGNEQGGTDIDLRRALAHSVNTVFDHLNVKVSPDATRQAAISAGIPSSTPGLATDYTNILGTASPRVLDMANAYATVAAQGMRATPYIVRKVTSLDGNLSYTVKRQLSPAFDKDVTIDLTDAMEQVVKTGTGTGALALGRPAAGKTGTTTDNLAVWFDGFTPQLATAVAMYKGDGTQPMKNIAGLNELTGGSFPVAIWTDFMRRALEGTKTLDFPGRVGIGDDKVKPLYTPPPLTLTPPPSSSATTTSTSPTSSPGPSSPTSSPTSTATATATSTATTTRPSATHTRTRTLPPALTRRPTRPVR